MSKTLTILLLLPLLLFGDDPFPPWIAYFSDKAPVESFKIYKWIALDRFEHPPIRPLLNQGKIVFGYVTLGEVDNFEPWFNEVVKEGITFHANPVWEESLMVDMRDPRWSKRVIEKVIPFVLHKGFNGLFLDTVDNAANLEEEDPEKYKGMKQAAIRLVKAIRLNFPDIKLMMNRGLDVASEVANDIDFIIGEDVFSQYDQKRKIYFRTTRKQTDKDLALMRAAKKINPNLVLLSLDYADPTNRSERATIYRLAKDAGLDPYVGTIDLDQIIPPP